MLLFMLGMSIPDQMNRFIQDYNVSQFEESPSEMQTVNADFLMEKFSQSEEYDIFVTRNHEYVEDLELYRDGGHLRLTAFNTTTNNILELRLSWDNGDFVKMDKDAYCKIGNSLDRAEITARESAVTHFLKTTDCVN